MTAFLAARTKSHVQEHLAVPWLMPGHLEALAEWLSLPCERDRNGLLDLSDPAKQQRTGGFRCVFAVPPG